MSYVEPKPGRYRRLKDGAEVTVVRCNGSTALSSVTVRGKKLYHVQLGWFWKNYKLIGVDCWRCENTPAVGVCCSAHNKSMCHGCYRLTHFVERCVKGCRDCATEGLPLVLIRRTVTS